MKALTLICAALLFVLGCGAGSVVVAADTPITSASHRAPELAQVQYIPSEMVRLMQAQYAVTFVDVRGHTSFIEEHIEGALDTPLVDLRAGKLPKVPKDQLIVTYCGCPHAMAEEGASLLIRAGFQSVAVLDDGFYAWKDLGYPVAISSAVKTFAKLEFNGTVPASYAGQSIEIADSASGQMEKGTVGKDGSFALHMPYYGESKGVQFKIKVGARAWSVPYEAGKPLKLP